MTKVFSKIKPNKLIASILKFSEIKDKRTDICPNEEYIQLPNVDNAIPAFKELDRLMEVYEMEVNLGSPFAQDFIPIDQLCYNN